MADERYVIKSEADAWALARRILSGEIKEISFEQVEFAGWPVTTAYVDLERLDRALTPYMMRGFIDLQNALFRSYAETVHGDGRATRLTDPEREILELIVRVESGSSDSEINWTDVFKAWGVALAAKMNGKHVVLLLLGAGLLYTGGSNLRAYLDGQKEVQLAETNNKTITEALSTVRFAIDGDEQNNRTIARMKRVTPQLRNIEDHAEDARQSVVRHYTKNQNAEIDGVAIEGDVGQRLTRSPRAPWQETRLDGSYTVVRIDVTDPLSKSLTLRDASNQREFTAVIEDRLLNEKAWPLIRNAIQSEARLDFKVNARIRNDQIADATIISVTRPRSKPRTSASR